MVDRNQRTRKGQPSTSFTALSKWIFLLEFSAPPEVAPPDSALSTGAQCAHFVFNPKEAKVRQTGWQDSGAQAWKAVTVNVNFIISSVDKTSRWRAAWSDFSRQTLGLPF